MELGCVEFDRIARDVFAPAYLSIADQIIDRTAVTHGMCLDIGTGGGYLGIALARITDLHFFLLDKSSEMLDIATANIRAEGLGNRIWTLFGNVHNIPLSDNSIDLVVSRGSVFFWENKPCAFREIYRVLAPKGRAYVGGGLGAPHVREEILAKMKKIGKDWSRCTTKDASDNTEEYREALQKAGIERYAVTKSDIGTWIEIWK